MQGWRRAVGTLLLWTPLVIFFLLGLSGVLLGSFGVDVHWTSKEAPYVVTTCVVLVVCSCLAAGLKLRKGTKT
jgi:heme/copper-type cytochrome/quinol oxidase subunit 1